MFARPLYLNRLRKYRDTEFIKVITGVRRSGKTFLLQMLKNDLLKSGIAPEQIIDINFESMKYLKLTEKEPFYNYVMQRAVSGKKMYLFFDEVQRVNQWQDAVNSFRIDLDADIYISGSNASLLSGELATLLTGRMVEIPVYPLSFREYLLFKQSTDKPDIEFYRYINEGGFPAAVLSPDPEVKRTVIDGIYSSILLKDVTERAKIRDDQTLIRLSQYLLSEVGNQISANKIAGVLKNEGFKSANNVSISRYLHYLTDAYLFHEAKRFDIRGKNYLRSNSKYYAIDLGLRNTTLNKNYKDNIGHQIENVVYLELLRRGYKVDVGKDGNQEIDFVAKKGNEIEYYQVTQQIPDNSDREIQNLMNISDNYKKTLITANRMDVGEQNGIPIVHIIDWLLEE